MITGALNPRRFNTWNSFRTVASHADKVDEVQGKLRKANALGVIAIGRELAAAQEKLSRFGNGMFCKWIKMRLRLSRPLLVLRPVRFDVRKITGVKLATI